MNIRLALFVSILVLASCTDSRKIDLETENVELKATVDKLTNELDSVTKIVEYKVEQEERALEYARKAMRDAMEGAGMSDEEIQETLDFP